MRCANRFSMLFGAMMFSALALAFGSSIFDGEGAAQVEVQPVPAQPVQVQPVPQQPVPVQPVQPVPEVRPVPEQRAPLPRPVVEVGDLMRLFNKPLYTSLKEKMAQQPASEQEWDDLLARGLQASEIANLVAIRQVEVPREQWLQGAAGLQSAGVAFADAAKARNWEATQQAYRGVLGACNKCHQAAAPDEAPQLRP